MLGIKSNRGSPHSAVAPLIVIVKPPGRSFQALMLSAREDLVCGHPVVSHSGLPEQRPRLTDSSARCAIPCTTVEHIAKDAVKGGLCLDKRKALSAKRNTYFRSALCAQRFTLFTPCASRSALRMQPTLKS